MDIANMYKHGMRSCGRVLKILPQSEIGSPEEYMREVVQRDLLPALNDILPILVGPKTFRLSAFIKVADGDVHFSSEEVKEGIDVRYNAYRVPPALLGGGEMIGIKNYHEAYGNGTGFDGIYGVGLGNMYPNRYGRFSSANMYARSVGNMVNFVDAQLMGTMQPGLRMRYKSPNILLINKPYADRDGALFTITFKVSNDPELLQVPDTSFMPVTKLFILYLKRSIYDEYAMFSEIDTTTGSPVNLGISEWSSAESDADSYFMELKQSAHLRNTSMISG